MGPKEVYAIGDRVAPKKPTIRFLDKENVRNWKRKAANVMTRKGLLGGKI